jgi:hypothetical protein
MINYMPFGGRGVAANMRPCQGRDRGFEPRRSRQTQKNVQQMLDVFALSSIWLHYIQLQ